MLWVISRSLRIATIGVSLGALAVVASFLLGGMPDAAQAVGVIQWVVVALVPLLTWVVARNDLLGPERDYYRATTGAQTRLLAVAILGGLLATALYYTLVAYAPPVIRGFDAAAWRMLVDRQVDGTRFVVVAVVAVVGALAVSAWVQGQVSSS